MREKPFPSGRDKEAPTKLDKQIKDLLAEIDACGTRTEKEVNQKPQEAELACTENIENIQVRLKEKLPKCTLVNIPELWRCNPRGSMTLFEETKCEYVIIPEGEKRMQAGIEEDILYVSDGIHSDLQPYYVLYTFIRIKLFDEARSLETDEAFVVGCIKDDELKRRYLKERMEFHRSYANVYHGFHKKVGIVLQYLQDELARSIHNKRLQNF